MKNKNLFPLIDAFLLLPKEGENGVVGICTNTTSPGEVFNNIELGNRKEVSVLGPLIVNRDGTERMILNSLVHPAMKYLILFSEESLTFSPSTNLLQAIQYGFDKKNSGNYIKNGLAAAPQYPNISEGILEKFRKEIMVLPLFMHKNANSDKVVENYLKWLRSKINDSIYNVLIGTNKNGKIYYDSLNKILKVIKETPLPNKIITELNSKDFQNLQPPRIELGNKRIKFKIPFSVKAESKQIRVDFKIGKESFFLRGENDFFIGYALMKFLRERKKIFSPLEQLLLGAEMGRVKLELINDSKFPNFSNSPLIKGKKEIKLESIINLKTDKKFYYRVGVKGEKISVACLSYDSCEDVFELQSKSLEALIYKLAELNRFDNYEMDILHRIDIGSQIGKAAIAAKLGYLFVQDFENIFKINTQNLPFIIGESDNFLGVHRNILLKTYSEGLTENHGDEWKGLARSSVVLGIFRNASLSLKNMPLLYKQGDQEIKQMRQSYKKQLLRFDHDGSYSYGERTRSHFGFDQLELVIRAFKKIPSRAVIVQRFDPIVDMSVELDKETEKKRYSHDPCLTHDIYFILNGKLNSFHIARAHNLVNAYPENIFGLYDAYVSEIRNKLKLKSGDMYMLSNRANILLLTEDQRTKKILAESSKPSEELNRFSGPYNLKENFKIPKRSGVAYIRTGLKKSIKRPKSKILERLENFEGINILDKAIEYLKNRGAMHNNPIISEYQAGVSDPQGEYLSFFQANVTGKKVNATAVFMNRSINNKNRDINLCSYMASRYGKILKKKLGELIIFYINF